MEYEINIKNLISEIRSKKKLIICISLIVAVIFSCYSYFSATTKINNQIYGYEGELLIEKDNSIKTYDTNYLKETGKNVAESDFNTEAKDITLSLIMSDNVLESVERDPTVKKLGLTKVEIRNMVNAECSKEGSLVKVTVASGNEDVAQIICDKLLYYVVVFFESKEYRAEIIKMAAPLGPVSIEKKVSEAIEGEIITIITPINEVSINIFYIIKSMIVGLIIGLVSCCIGVCGYFIIRNNITYPEQIEDTYKVKVINNEQRTKDYLEVYSGLEQSSKVVNYCSLGHIDSEYDYATGFVELLCNANKKVLLIACDDTSEALCKKYIGGSIYWQMKLDNEHLIKDNIISEIQVLKEDYDYIVISSGDIIKNPAARLITRVSDKNIFLLRKNTLKIGGFQKLYVDFGMSNSKIDAVVMLN